jgi:biofilm protein TabA
MILDTLEQAHKYYALNPRFARAFSELRDRGAAPSGKVEIDGSSLTLTYSRAAGKQASAAILEAHRAFIDIHYCIEGSEEIGWRPIHACLSPLQAYDETKDFMTFRDAPLSWNKLTPGSFLIVFPEDAHAPLVSSGTVVKAVVKVAVEG